MPYRTRRNGCAVTVFRSSPGNWYGATGWVIQIHGGGMHDGFRTRRAAIAAIARYV